MNKTKALSGKMFFNQSSAMAGFVVLFLMSSLAGCSNNNAKSVADGGTTNNASTAVTQRVGAAGGTVKLLSGATLVIPPGALSQDVDISIIQSSNGIPQDLAVTTLSALYEFSPDGLVFNLPVTVSMPVTGSATDGTVYWTLPATTDQYEAIGGVPSSDGTVMEVAVTHFSRGFVGKKMTPADPVITPNLDGGFVQIRSSNAVDFFKQGQHVHTCALRSDGTVWCWGTNISGELGTGAAKDATDTFIPKQVLTEIPDPIKNPTPAAFADVAHIVAANKTTCALKVDGSLWCWGSNEFGLLGNGRGNYVAKNFYPDPTPEACLYLSLYCSQGFAGLPDPTCWDPMNAFIPTPVSQIYDYLPSSDALDVPDQIFASGTHVCVVMKNTRHGFCWGGQGGGKDVNGADAFAIEPYAQSGYACNEGAPIFPGDPGSPGDPNAQPPIPPTLARNDIPSGLVPKSIGGPNSINWPTFNGLAVGQNRMCGVMTDGKVVCVGGNPAGELGYADTATPYRSAGDPPETVGTSGAVTGLFGIWRHFCAIVSDGSLQCWGDDASGQVGVPVPGPVNILRIDYYPITVPTAVTGPLGIAGGVLDVATGLNHTCAIAKADGNVWCWGTNDAGQLGDAASTPLVNPAPVQVTGFHP